jgi:hypothetical protein
MPRRKTLTERPNLRLRLLTEPFSYPPEGSGPIVRASATPTAGGFKRGGAASYSETNSSPSARSCARTAART